MKFVTLILLALLGFSVEEAHAKTVVKVGGYEFPPYIEIVDGRASGLTVELISELNKMQHSYHFELVLTTPIRRFKDYQKGLFDSVFFENPDWGWLQGNNIISNSPVIATDSEVFIALKQFAKSQAWFDNLENRTLVGILGYHYPLANYESNPSVLENEYKMTLLSNHKRSIELVLKKRSDSAIVTRSYLNQYFSKYPKSKHLLLVSERIAQTYNHQLLLRPTHTLDISTLYKWVKRALAQDKIAARLKQLGLQQHPLTPLPLPSQTITPN
ncbi:amino acid ABC transporter substrate-binding protein [Pseudoalteromonas sp. SK18]|uniref:amino acid ABC transporter substrate-binding protein n=1 Tax=Pseudoalteromonas sp. SK18 TaxID=1938366 RepID=UPI0009767FAE|nr:amino acid ABC transporter substrate-binding protein [Pseudoalteromonas sp. SK18]